MPRYKITRVYIVPAPGKIDAMVLVRGDGKAEEYLDAEFIREVVEPPAAGWLGNRMDTRVGLSLGSNLPWVAVRQPACVRQPGLALGHRCLGLAATPHQRGLSATT